MKPRFRRVKGNRRMDYVTRAWHAPPYEQSLNRMQALKTLILPVFLTIPICCLL